MAPVPRKAGMGSLRPRTPIRRHIPGAVSRSAGVDRLLDGFIQQSLSWPYPGWVAPTAHRDIKAILDWLEPDEEHLFDVLTQIVNMALGHRSMLDDQNAAGHLKDHIQTLQQVADQSKMLAASLKALEEGARLIWMHAEVRMGEIQPGRGLFPELHLDRLPKLSDLRFDEEKGWMCTKQLDHPSTTDPEIDSPIGELSDRLDRVLVWAKVHRGAIGRTTASAIVMGPPELDLFRDAKVGLTKLGLDPRKSYELGCRIHLVVTGETPSKHWGDESNRRVDAWFEQVGPWIGREIEAPKAIRLLLEKGPNTSSRRKRIRVR